jgi:hypothetical protein
MEKLKKENQKLEKELRGMFPESTGLRSFENFLLH